MQRFGSKRELLLALSNRIRAATREMFEGLRRGRRSPLAVLRAYAGLPGGLATSRRRWRAAVVPAVDLTDPDFRTHMSGTRERPVSIGEDH